MNSVVRDINLILVTILIQATVSEQQDPLNSHVTSPGEKENTTSWDNIIVSDSGKQNEMSAQLNNSSTVTDKSDKINLEQLQLLMAENSLSMVTQDILMDDNTGKYLEHTKREDIPGEIKSRAYNQTVVIPVMEEKFQVAKYNPSNTDCTNEQI